MRDFEAGRKFFALNFVIKNPGHLPDRDFLFIPHSEVYQRIAKPYKLNWEAESTEVPQSGV